MKKLASKGLLMSALICGNVLWGGITVLANEVQEYELDEMVVTATRTAQENIKVPAQVNVITAEDIKEKNVLTITDALKTIPGLYDGRAGGMSDVANSIQIRGFAEDEILVLYDGMPLNDGYSGNVNWSAIAIDDVAKIEVLHGAASSLYGGRAVGGVINIISKNPDKDSVHVYANYGSDSTWKRGINLSKKLNDKWSLGFGYENKETDGHYKKLIYKYKTKAMNTPASGSVIGTGAVADKHSNGKDMYILGQPGGGRSEDNTYNFKIKYNFTDKQSMTYRYTHDKYKYFATDPVTFIHDADGKPMFSGSVLLPDGKYLDFTESDFTDYDGRRNIDRHALQYKDDENNINFNLGLTNVKDYGYATGSDLAGQGSGNDAKYPSKAYKADFQKVWEGSKNTVVAGFNVQKDTMEYVKANLSKWSDKDSITSIKSRMGGTNLNGALFVQDDLKLSDVYGLTMGLRLDHYQKKDGFFDDASTHIDQREEKYTELSPKLAFKYMPDEDTTYYVSYGHSFNAPSLYKLYRHDPAYGYVANPDLKPETSDTFEIGLKKNFGSKLYTALALYTAKTTDMINAETRSDGKKWYVNIDEAKRQGAELALDYQIDNKFSTFANINLKHAVDGAGDRIYSVPKQLLKAGVKYNYDKWTAYINGQYVSSRNTEKMVGGKLYAEDGFFTADAGLSYKFMKNGTISFAVNNIFDRDYWQWYKADGRSWNVGVDFTF